MNRAEKPEAEPEGQALRDRLSRMSEASLRINESLDFNTVLPEEQPFEDVSDASASGTGTNPIALAAPIRPLQR